MRISQIVFTVVSSFVVFSASACTGPATPISPTQPPVQSTQAPKPTKTPAATATPKTAVQQIEVLNASNFDHSSDITNAWLPLKPGTRFTYEGTTVDDHGAVVPHRIVVNVTDLGKLIAGVRARVTWDEDYRANVLAEAELAFYAQDKDGNVWYVGEYPEAYENGKLVEVPTWIHGIEGAKAGIMMKAEPKLGMPAYPEGWGPAVNWTDTGQVDQMGVKTCVPVSCYENVLVISETSQGEPNANQLKYYARNVGNIRVGWRGGGEKTKEILELVKIEQLSLDELSKVRVKAQELEKSAYKNSKDVYASTSPLEQVK